MNQWIRFNLNGMIFKIRIYGFGHGVEWLKTSFRFKFEDIIDYRCDDVKIFTTECLDLLIEHMGKLLNNKFKRKRELSFFEPDFEFTFIPKTIIKGYPPELENNIPIDISMELRVFLWHHGLTENHFSMCFERDDIQRFYDYLLKVKYGKEEQKV